MNEKPERVDIAQCSDLPITLVFLPAHDIAMFVGEGNVDIGITGLDVVRETSDESEIEVAMVSEGQEQQEEEEEDEEEEHSVDECV